MGCQITAFDLVIHSNSVTNIMNIHKIKKHPCNEAIFDHQIMIQINPTMVLLLLLLFSPTWFIIPGFIFSLRRGYSIANHRRLPQLENVDRTTQAFFVGKIAFIPLCQLLKTTHDLLADTLAKKSIIFTWQSLCKCCSHMSVQQWKFYSVLGQPFQALSPL